MNEFITFRQVKIHVHRVAVGVIWLVTVAIVKTTRDEFVGLSKAVLFPLGLHLRSGTNYLELAYVVFCSNVVKKCFMRRMTRP